MSDLTVETRAGKVRGKREITCNGHEFCSFKGIPYAKPPVGELRFRDPQPLESWTGIREATGHGPKCAHKDYFTNEIVGGDDCLYLNVYARCIKHEKRWPVMVWVHGGGFIHGSGDDSLYGPDFFMPKDVVLVTINYRLGVLGFLNLDDMVATGNQGLKDQVMALEWVRDNIANFGGDPNNVTICGPSAGSAAVHYLTISPLAKGGNEGLFHKAISQSGVALNSWAYHSNLKDKSYRLCELLGHTKRDPKLIVAFLRTIDAQKLIEAQEKMLTKEEQIQFEFAFGPSIDSKSKSPFMPVHPEEAAAKGVDVPLIIGYDSREGILLSKPISEYLDHSGSEISKIIPSSLKDTLKKHYNLTFEDLMRIYFNDEPTMKQSLEKLADFAGDLHFVEGIQRVIKTQIVKNCAPTYVYQFTYDKGPSIVKLMANIQMSGASHGDDVICIFRMRCLERELGLVKKGSVAGKISEQMIELWVNFATTGKPTPKLSELLPVDWQPVDDKSGLRYLNICDDLRMEVALDIGQQYIARQYPKHCSMEI